MTLLPPEVAAALDHPELSGRFEVLRLLGKGGMGAVVEARDRKLERNVALKLVLRVDRDGARRLVREGKMLARVSHPGIVRVYDTLLAGDVPALVLELVTGVTLQDELARARRFDVRRAVRLASSILEPLSAAHRAGLVHRDLKPANVMVLGAGEIKLLDFGLARPVDLDPDSSARITATGIIAGTPAYMSPEQCRGEAAAAPSDLYAVGVMLHEMITGAVPFTGKQPLEVMLAHLHERRPDLAEVAPWVPGPIAEVMNRALAREPDRRPADASAMSRELLAALEAGGDDVDGETLTGPAASVPAPVRLKLRSGGLTRAPAPRGKTTEAAGAAYGKPIAPGAPERGGAVLPGNGGRIAGVAALVVLIALVVWRPGGRAVLPEPASRSPAPSAASPSLASSGASPSPLRAAIASLPSAGTPLPASAGAMPLGRVRVPSGQHVEVARGQNRSLVQLRSDRRAILYLFGREIPLYRDLANGRVSDDPYARDASRWARLGESPPGIVHRIPAEWTGKQEARILKVTQTDEPGAAPLALFRDVRIGKNSPFQDPVEVVGLEIVPDLMQGRRCEPPRDFRATLEGGRPFRQRSAIDQLSNLLDDDAAGQLCEYLERMARTGVHLDDTGRMLEALTFAGEEHAVRVWIAIRDHPERIDPAIQVAILLAGLVSRHERVAALVARNFREMPHAPLRICAGWALWISDRPDSRSEVESVLARCTYEERALAERFMAIPVPGFGEQLAALGRTSPAWAEWLGTALPVKNAKLRRDGALASLLVAARLHDRFRDNEIEGTLALASHCALDGPSVTALDAIARGSGPRGDRAALALARGGHPAPPIEGGRKPTAVLPLALGLDRHRDHRPLLLRWAQDSELAVPVRASAAFALCLRDHAIWPAYRETIRSSSKDGGKPLAAHLEMIDRWLATGLTPDAVPCAGGPGRVARDAARALVILLPTPAECEAPSGVWAKREDRIKLHGPWGWWDPQLPSVRFRSTVYLPKLGNSGEEVLSYGGWDGEIALAVEPETGLAGPEAGLMWAVVERQEGKP